MYFCYKKKMKTILIFEYPSSRQKFFIFYFSYCFFFVLLFLNSKFIGIDLCQNYSIFDRASFTHFRGVVRLVPMKLELYWRILFFFLNQVLELFNLYYRNWLFWISLSLFRNSIRFSKEKKEKKVNIFNFKTWYLFYICISSQIFIEIFFFFQIFRFFNQKKKKMKKKKRKE